MGELGLGLMIMMDDCSDLMKAEKMASWMTSSSDDSMVMVMDDCSDSTKTKAEKMASWMAPNSDDSMDLEFLVDLSHKGHQIQS